MASGKKSTTMATRCIASTIVMNVVPCSKNMQYRYIIYRYRYSTGVLLFDDLTSIYEKR